MLLKSSAVLLFLFAVACDRREIGRVEKFKLDTFVATPVCAIWVGDLPEEENVIIEKLLGLNDSIYSETFLDLYDNGKFNIIKGERIALSGDWCMRENDVTFMAKNAEWRLEIETKNSDSLVVNFKNYYQSLTDLHITLKHY